MTLNAAEMGLTESSFWRLTFVEYQWKWNGYNRKVERDQSGARMVYSMVHNTSVEKRHQKSPIALWRFNIDPKEHKRTTQDYKDFLEHAIKNWN